MPKFETVKRMPYSAEKIYEIVADVERYPEFLPLCEKLIIDSRSEKEGNDILHADMTVTYKAFNETFRSEVTLDRQKNRIQSVNLSGPFTHLLSDWQFNSIANETCDVHFTIDYAFKNWMMQKVMGGLFDKAFQTYITSFEKRAAFLYGVT